MRLLVMQSVGIRLDWEYMYTHPLMLKCISPIRQTLVIQRCFISIVDILWFILHEQRGQNFFHELCIIGAIKTFTSDALGQDTIPHAKSV